MRDLDIVPECFVDTNLVETLLAIKGYKTDGVNHQKGCTTVVRTIQTAKNLKDGFALGIIDADKRKPSYLEECVEIASLEHIALWKHKAKHHFLLLIKPAMDTFILSCAQEIGVELAQYGLPTELKAFTEITKRVETKNDTRFKRLFKDIQSASEMVVLGNVLAYFKAHKYDYNLNVLKACFG